MIASVFRAIDASLEMEHEVCFCFCHTSCPWIKFYFFFFLLHQLLVAVWIQERQVIEELEKAVPYGLLWQFGYQVIIVTMV
jgi:hypothetical protein